MNFKYVDFEKVTSHYVEYRNGIEEINTKKAEFLKEIDPIRKELNSILSSVQSGIIIDTTSQQQKAERFQQLQNDIMQKDSEFKRHLKKMHDDLNEKCFDKLSEVISDWAKDNGIDVVSSKMETIFVTEKFDATKDIVELLKVKDIYSELPEVNEEKVSA